MSLNAYCLEGLQLVMPDGRRNDINFSMGAPLTDRGDHYDLAIELDHLEYTLRVQIRVLKKDGTVEKKCIGIHKETGAEVEFMFMPLFAARVTNLNRRTIGEELKQKLSDYPESQLYSKQPPEPTPFPGVLKFPFPI